MADRQHLRVKLCSDGSPEIRGVGIERDSATEVFFFAQVETLKKWSRLD